jgi:two-component system nitrate/nitrite response regulator NarL
VIKTTSGTSRVQVPMVALPGQELFAALLLEPGAAAAPSRPFDDGGPMPRLTGRQTTVLEMLADGKPARAIAAELHLSEMTVRNHIRAILREFGCSSQLTAVAKARRVGLV